LYGFKTKWKKTELLSGSKSEQENEEITVENTGL
jgi:hypothetical protein